MCHTAARTSPVTTTRREMRRSNFGVAKNSRMANRYAMPATVKKAMKYGPPLSPKLREQIVSATHKVAPSTYTLHAGLIFREMTFTILPCPSGGRSERLSENAPPQAPTLSATPLCAAPLPDLDATPPPTASGRQLHQYRKKELRNLQIAQEFVRAIGVSPARCWCPFRRVRKAQNEKPLPLRDSSLRRALVQRLRHV